MLIHLHHLSQAITITVIMALMVVAWSLLHPLHGCLFQKLHALGHPQCLPLRLHSGENRIHPGVTLTAKADEQIALLHRQNVRSSVTSAKSPATALAKS